MVDIKEILKEWLTYQNPDTVMFRNQEGTPITMGQLLLPEYEQALNEFEVCVISSAMRSLRIQQYRDKSANKTNM